MSDLLLRFVIQRASEAEVTIAGESCGRMGRGLVVLVGIGQTDPKTPLDAAIVNSSAQTLIEKSLDKIIALRIFEDERGKMNLSLSDIQGSLYLISQFTLFADVKKGNRPSFTNALRPELSKPLFQNIISTAQQKLNGLSVFQGEFGADMKVALVSDGPVTISFDLAHNGVQ